MAKGKGAEKIVRGSHEIVKLDGREMRRMGDMLVPVAEPDGELFDEATQEEDILSPALQSVIAELGATDEQSKVIVKRLSRVNGAQKSEFLFERHPTEFSLSDLQETYGAGDYQVIVYGKQAGTNYKVIQANKRVSIGATPEQMKSARAPFAAPDVAKSVTEALAPVLSAMTQMLGNLAAKSSVQPSRREMLEEMQLIAGMFKQSAPASDPLALLTGVLGVAEKLRPAADLADPEAAPYAVISKALEVFGPLVASRQAPAEHEALALAAPKPAASAPAAEAKPGAAAPQPSEDEEMNRLQRAALAGQMMILLNAAKIDADPEMYATLVYENAPDEVLKNLDAPNWFEFLCGLEGGFAQYHPWCEKVHAELKSILAQEAAASGGENLTGDVPRDTVGMNVAATTTGTSGPGKPAGS